MVMGELPENVDLAVVGGGVGGYVAAIRAAELGLNVVLVEKEKLGGHCLNYACIPSKTLIHIADIFHEIGNSEKFGIKTSGAEIDAKKMLEWRLGVSKKLEGGVEFLCRQNGIEVMKSEATFLNSGSIQLQEGMILKFGKAIIATGSEPVNLPGFEFGGSIIDYKKALMLDSIPKNMVIIGAGYVAVELGMLYAKLGSKISIIARTDVLSRVDKDAVDLIKGEMKGLGIDVYTNETPKAHDGRSVVLSNGKSLDADVTVVAIGLAPYTKNLGLENTKVRLDGRGFVQVDGSMRTSDANILAIGDVVGEPMLAHKAMRQGVVAAEVAKGMNSSFDNLVIPSVIFSDPEIALAGSIEEREGIRVIKFPLSALGRSIALDTTRGFAKIAYEENGVVKGVEIVSREASSMISEAVLAIEMGATVDDIAETIHPHPTYSEAVQEAAEAAIGAPIHFFYGKPREE